MNEDNKITIIIADDNTEWSKAMQKYLQQFKEFEILGITFDGEEQIQMIKTLQPDIVITDLKRKKGISGLDVIQKCQEMQLTKTKFIVETGAYYKEQINVLISMGIKYILFKPYTLDDLENKINAIKNEDVRDLTIVNNTICKNKISIIEIIRKKLMNLRITRRKG